MYHPESSGLCNGPGWLLAPTWTWSTIHAWVARKDREIYFAPASKHLWGQRGVANPHILPVDSDQHWELQTAYILAPPGILTCSPKWLTGIPSIAPLHKILPQVFFPTSSAQPCLVGFCCKLPALLLSPVDSKNLPGGNRLLVFGQTCKRGVKITKLESPKNNWGVFSFFFPPSAANTHSLTAVEKRHLKAPCTVLGMERGLWRLTLGKSGSMGEKSNTNATSKPNGQSWMGRDWQQPTQVRHISSVV